MKSKLIRVEMEFNEVANELAKKNKISKTKATGEIARMVKKLKDQMKTIKEIKF